MDGARVGTAFLDVKADFSSANAEVASFAGKLGKTGKLAAGLGAVAVAAGVAGKALYDIGAEFDDAFDTIRTGTGKTGKQLRGLQRDFKAVVYSVPADFGDAGEAISELNRRLDLTGKPLRTLSKQFLELSRITESDLQGNIQTVTRLFGDWGIKTKEQPKTLDKLFRASQATGIEISKLSDYMVQFGSPLRQLGFDFDTSAAMFSKFEKEGVNLQTAMPGLRMALKNFASAGEDPAKALGATIDKIKNAGSAAKANTMAFDIFGTRAGPDLAAAIREGRFDFDKLIKTIRGGQDTVMKAGKNTRDFDENMKLLGNRLKVLLAPAARFVYDALGDLSGILARLNFNKLAKSLGLSQKDLRDFGEAARAVGKIFGSYLTRVINAWSDFTATHMKSTVEIIKGAVKVISAVLEGDFGKAWDGVKEIFRGGVNNAIGYLNMLIDALNAIPGLPDIGHVGEIGGGDDSKYGKGGTGNWNPKKDQTKPGRARGGPVFGGEPSGDTVPAMLERGEYVLNRKAVDAIGKTRLDNLNFKQAPRFSLGGALGSAADFVTSGGVAGKALDLAGKGASYFVGKLPKPDLPPWLTGVGSYVVDQVSNFITSGFKSGELGSKGGLGGLKGSGRKLMQEISKRKGWNFDDWWALDAAETSHGANLSNPSSSARLRGQFLDMNYGKYGPGSDPAANPSMREQIISMARYIAERYGSPSAAWAWHQAHNWYAKGGLIGGDRNQLASFTSMSGGEQVNSAIADLVAPMIKAFHMDITDALGSGHQSPGHTVTGTALDVVPSDGNWNGAFAAGLQKLSELGFEVGYDGSLGTLDWSDNSSSGVTGHGPPGQTDTPHAHIEMVGNGTAGDARKRLREFLAGAGGGGGGLTEGQETKRQAEARKKQRETMLKKLRSAVGDAKTGPAKLSSLWKLMKFWGRVGIFDKGERGHILDAVQQAASKLDPEGRIPILSRLAKYSADHGEITGRDPENWHEMTDAMKKAQERGQDEREKTVKKHQRQRARRVARIADRGNFADLAAMLTRHETGFNLANQDAERLVALEPENISDTYVEQEKGAWGSVLGKLGGWRDSNVVARNTANYKREVLEGELQSLRELKGEPFRKQKWRIPALREAITNAKTFVSDRVADMQGFQGFGGPQTVLGDIGEGSPWWLTLGGPGTSIFDTQNTIRELGLKGIGAADGSEELERVKELLLQANQRTLIAETLGRARKQYEGSYPLEYMGAYAQGGVALVGERGPELAHMPSGTRVHNAADTEQLLSPKVELTINGDVVQQPGDTRDPVEMVINDRRFAPAVRGVRASNRFTPSVGPRRAP